ncbi:MAG: small, acid-soluble spore protein, H family [Bacillota bacterium]
MKLERAQEILNSPKTVRIAFNGAPVWIESLNPDQQTAIVSAEDFSTGKKEVPVDELVEIGG